MSNKRYNTGTFLQTYGAGAIEPVTYDTQGQIERAVYLRGQRVSKEGSDLVCTCSSAPKGKEH